jgi:iron complex outermembrane receptor protein
MLRGRRVARDYGGGDRVNVGSTSRSEPFFAERPAFVWEATSSDELEQLGVGIAYRHQWEGRGEFSAGGQWIDYNKVVERGGGAAAVKSGASETLLNVTAAYNLSDRLAVYASFTQGLEESGLAPDIAQNSNEATPPLPTSQYDLGLRYKWRSFNINAGYFNIDKEYYNIDESNVYGRLGLESRRGVELSLSGSIAPGAAVLAGLVAMEPGIDAGGDPPRRLRPIGLSEFSARAAVDYALPIGEGWSVSLSGSYLGRAPSGRPDAQGRQAFAHARTIINVGLRKRLDVAGAPASVRLQLSNLGDDDNWQLTRNGGFLPAPGRRISLVYAMDF